MAYVSAMPGLYRPRYYRGMGDIPSGAYASAGTGAASIISTAGNENLPTSTRIESSIASGLLSAAPFTGPAAPFVAAAGAAAALLAAMGVGSGCGQTCVISTKYANQAEAVLKQNLQTYLAQRPRYYSAQQAALGVFNAVWNDMVAQCSNPSLGNAGVRCITDRQSGACKSEWMTNGQCWNWWIGYHDPIANDGTVQPDPTPTVSSTVSDLTSSLGLQPGSAVSSLLPLALVGALVIWAVS